jgi:hypothetical protein
LKFQVASFVHSPCPMLCLSWRVQLHLNSTHKCWEISSTFCLSYKTSCAPEVSGVRAGASFNPEVSGVRAGTSFNPVLEAIEALQRPTAQVCNPRSATQPASQPCLQASCDNSGYRDSRQHSSPSHKHNIHAQNHSTSQRNLATIQLKKICQHRGRDFYA